MIIFSSCGTDDLVTSGSDEPVEYDCKTFFDNGDYSSICFAENDGFVVDVEETPSGSTCIVQLGIQPGTVNDYVTVVFLRQQSYLKLLVFLLLPKEYLKV